MSRSPRLALVSIDPTWEDPSGEFTPFTYGVRKLEAAIVANPELAHVEVKVIDLRSSDPEAFFETLMDFGPTLVGASLFAWSIGPFEQLATRLRSADPSIRIVVGGPHARKSVFAMPRYQGYRDVVDAAIEGEGEGILQELALRHLDDDWLETPGMLVPHALGWKATAPAPRVDLEAHPSPYELDLAPRGFTGYLETFRGCPIHCSFCQWGEQAADRVYSVEALERHLLGLKRARVPNVFNLDAAFNLSPRAFRNLAEAERRVGVLKDTTVHGHLYPTLLTPDHLELLGSFGRTQVAIGVQSFDPLLLKKLGRPFDVARFDRVIADLRGHVPIELELMLGLPGDTPEGFRQTFHRAMEIADTVKVFWTLVLPDALLDRSGDEALVFDPETWLIDSCTGWTNEALHRELAYVKDVAKRHPRAVIADFWAGFALERDDAPRRDGPAPNLDTGSFRLPTILHRSLGDVERADDVLRVMDAHGVDEDRLEASVRGTQGDVRGGRMMLENVSPACARDILEVLWAGVPFPSADVSSAGVSSAGGADAVLIATVLELAAVPHAKTIVGWDATPRQSKLYLNLSDVSEEQRRDALERVWPSAAATSPAENSGKVSPHVIGLNVGLGGTTLKLYTQLLSAPSDAPQPLLEWASELAIAGWVRCDELLADGSRRLRAVFAAPQEGAGELPFEADDVHLGRAWPYEPGCLRSVGFDAAGTSYTAYAKPSQHSQTVHSLDPTIVIREGEHELGLYREPASAEKAYSRTEQHALSYRVRAGEPSRDAVEEVMAWFSAATRAHETGGATSAPPEGWHVL